MAIMRTKRTSRRRKAVTSDILGAANRRERISPKWKQHYKRLVDLREHLLKRQSDVVREAARARPTFSLHMADAGTDSYDRDFALSRLSAEQDALYEIEEALDRIRARKFGVCELTGKPIEAERLAAIPWTRFSAPAEKTLEREGAVRRTRLGPRMSLREIESASRPDGATSEEEAAERD